MGLSPLRPPAVTEVPQLPREQLHSKARLGPGAQPQPRGPGMGLVGTAGAAQEGMHFLG